MTQHPRGFLTLSDIAPSAWPALFDRAAQLKADRAHTRPLPLVGMTVALVFEKPSTRTRVSFQVAAYELGGNALAAAAANAVLEIIETEALIERVAQAGQYLGTRLAELVNEFPGHATGVRGRGLLRGIVMAGSPVAVVARCRELGLLVSAAGSSVVRFAPPYVIERKHIDEAVAILRGVLSEGIGKA